MKLTVIPVVIGTLEIILKGLVNGLEALGIRGEHSDYRIIKIGQNTEKRPGDFRRLAITQTPMRIYQQMLV